MRPLLAAVLTATSLLLPTSPASALSEEVLTGTMHVNCFGCGTTSGTATFDVLGRGVAHANFNAYFSPFDCPLTGHADSGTITGAINGSFQFDKYGAAVVVRIGMASYTLNGAGTFLVAGSPCGGPTDATFAAVVVG